ncbi:MAG TPA: type I-C CRISPR-associated protein Cas5c [Thermoanaerobaculia bacterium]|nr:type I-C CRISPR-associated protein Cas5c [Thermoanaerobaculia bacterium]
MSSRSSPLSVRVRGSLACFTRPELKTERVSYEVMTPSAARGVLEAICWKPAIVWRIERIKVLAPIVFTSIRRNEVNARISSDSAISWMRGTERPEVYFADEDRAQRHTLALRDVDYVVEAYFELTSRAGTADNVNKFEEIFRRRVEKGQCFHRPYLGCREFTADFANSDGHPVPIPETRLLGRMLFDLDYGEPNRPLFFDAGLVDGVLAVPPWKGVAAA